MIKRTIETSLTPHLIINECLGNLVVRGDAQERITVSVRGSDSAVGWELEGDTLTLSVPGNGSVACPSGTKVTIKKVLGNLRVERLAGPAAVAAVHGNTKLRAVGPVSLDEALGNLSARDVAGQLEAQDIRGNVRIRGVGAELLLGEVAGNLVADGLQGGLTVDTVRGNAQLGPDFFPNTTLRLKGYGNLTVLVPASASLRVGLRVGGHARSLVPGLAMESRDGMTMGVLGAGETELEAEVNGNVTVRTAEPPDRVEENAGWDEVGAHIEWQLNDALARMATSLEETLGRVDGEWVRHGVDRATDQARRKAEQAAERARMRAERAERRWRRASGQRPATKRQEATDEERLRVLRMVEEGKITPDQASQLLTAIEGR